MFAVGLVLAVLPLLFFWVDDHMRITWRDGRLWSFLYFDAGPASFVIGCLLMLASVVLWLWRVMP